MYEFFEHTADLGLRVQADSLAGLFVDAARGLFSMIVANADEIQTTEEITFSLPGEPSELLLFDWLSELLYVYETRRLLLAEFEVRVDEHGLAATARGEPVDESRHLLEHEVKAITYHGLFLTRQGDTWTAEVIVDI